MTSRTRADKDAVVAQLDSVTKDFGATRALNGVSLRLLRGRLIGFLGPNGAGKTTTIRILMGLIKPTGGRCRIFDADPWRDAPEIHARIGYLPGDVHLYRDFTGIRILNLIARARGDQCAAETRRLADVFQLNLEKRVRNYSTGMRQKLGIILALMHRPDLLILDEPTASLDPLMQQIVYRELRDATNEGRTVLFSSHSLSEVESLCEEIVILRKGRVVAATNISELKKRAGQHVRVRPGNPDDVQATLPSEFAVHTRNGGEITGRWTGSMDQLADWLQALRPAEMVVRPPDLEDVFLAYYSDDEGPPL